VQVDLIETSKALSKIDEKYSKSMRDELFSSHTQAYFSFITTVGTYKKIQDAINQIEKVYYDRSLYLEKFNNFRDAINDFLQGGKEFNFDDDGTFRFSNKGRPVRISQLSSGEKHLIAIFGHLCVSNDDSSVFIADEPELSLHLEWQRKILPTINKLSPNTQVIVATHSPGIISRNSNKIDIEECYSYVK
ncbi:ATP-binding protein, partial [Vibrio harveyi]